MCDGEVFHEVSMKDTNVTSINGDLVKIVLSVWEHPSDAKTGFQVIFQSEARHKHAL